MSQYWLIYILAKNLNWFLKAIIMEIQLWFHSYVPFRVPQTPGSSVFDVRATLNYDRLEMKSWKALIYACTRKQHPLYPTVKLRTGPNYEIVNLLLHYGAVRFTSVSYTLFCTFLVCTATLGFVFCSITRNSHLCNWANYWKKVLSRYWNIGWHGNEL